METGRVPWSAEDFLVLYVCGSEGGEESVVWGLEGKTKENWRWDKGGRGGKLKEGGRCFVWLVRFLRGGKAPPPPCNSSSEERKKLV